MKYLGRGLTFDDICLVPQYSNVTSRTEPSLVTWATKLTQIDIPILNSPMESVISPKLAMVLNKMGTIPVFHRFYKEESKFYEDLETYGGPAYISMGLVRDDSPERLFNLSFMSEVVHQFGSNIKGVLIDVANGHSMAVLDSIKRVKDTIPDMQVIAGNVCTARAVYDLANAGASGIRVGIGPGAACTTRVVTGFGVPQFTALIDCAEEARRHKIPIIADGGVRNSRDAVLALAAGACTVMLGKLLAFTHESGAKKQFQKIGIKTQAQYRGQASQEFQRPGLKAEGVEMWGPVEGSAEEIINDFLAGIKSGLTYGGARDIPELQRKAAYMEVTPSYAMESNPRI